MDTNELYNSDDKKIMQLADSARLPGKNRIEEIRNYAIKAGFKRIGVAHCIALQNEANHLKEWLAPNFEVFTIDCKCGKIPASHFLGEGARGISCNPAGQADYLEQNKTDLNIVMGLCIGHDMVFNQKSAAPATTLIVKDREHKNNPVATFNINPDAN